MNVSLCEPSSSLSPSLTVTVLSAKSKSGKNCGSIEKVFALPTSFIDGYFSETTLIFDEKVAIMDTVDKRKTDEWLENLDRELNGRTPDYLVISHLEPWEPL